MGKKYYMFGHEIFQDEETGYWMWADNNLPARVPDGRFYADDDDSECTDPNCTYPH